MLEKWKEKYRREGRRQQLEYFRIKCEELHGEYYHMDDPPAAYYTEALIEYLQSEIEDGEWDFE